MMAVAAFALVTGNVQASCLGWTMKRCKDQWGEVTEVHPLTGQDRQLYCFETTYWDIAVAFLHDKVSRIAFKHDDGTDLSYENILGLLNDNAADPWSDPVKVEKLGEVHFEWYSKGAGGSFFATYQDKVLSIFTKEDADLIKQTQERASSPRKTPI
jgi:hypothetical protein